MLCGEEGDKARYLGGSELALLEEENMGWERVWNRSVAERTQVRG